MLDIIEEQKFAELRKNCRDLGVPAPPEIHICFEVVDNKGKLIFEDKQRGHSWTRNFYNWILGCTSNVFGDDSGVFGAGHMSSKSENGAICSSPTHSICTNGQWIALSALGLINNGETNTYAGIIVGTDDGAFGGDNYQLGAKVDVGLSSGQLSHLGQTYPIAQYDNTVGAEKWTVSHTRKFSNNSGETITIKETGLLGYGKIFDSSDAGFLFERSCLSPTVPVPNDAKLTVSYDISMDFSAIDS